MTVVAGVPDLTAFMANSSELGDTAAGLLSAGRNCQEGDSCHIILVNYRPARQPRAPGGRQGCR